MKNKIILLLFTTFILTVPKSFTQNSYWGSPVPIKQTEKKDKICFVLYTVQNSTLKMTVQFYPLEEDDDKTVYLEIKDGVKWKRIEEGQIRENPYGKYDAKAWNLTFRVPDWDQSKDYNYRINTLNGVAKYEGVIRHDPVEKKEIIVAAFTGNSAWDKSPRTDIVKNIKYQNPDLLFFSGDQVYHHTHHLAEWLLFGEYFGDITRDRPTVCIVDDHDVGQGNLWGSSGKVSKILGGPDGGYIQPAKYVKEVEFAQTSHLPDPYDPKRVKQGIGVYFTSLNVGGIDFGIVEDRKFKSGPLEIFPNLKEQKRPDHPKGISPDSLDSKKAILLGSRQFSFLRSWGENWENTEMKCILEATIFCQGHTDQKIDLDTNGWPQNKRDKALREIRKSFAFMIAGDQHLATIIHHGIDEFDDAGYSFAVPSIVNHYPRSWKPSWEPISSLEDSSKLKYLGRYFDPLGNRITMIRHSNPESFHVPINKENKWFLKSTGYGLVRFNKKQRDITIECWPRGVDVSKSESKQYPGWPVTIKQEDNYSRSPFGYLPTIEVKGMSDPVIQVTKENTGETVYTLRIKGNKYKPKVFEEGTYTITISDGKDRSRKFNGLKPTDKKSKIAVTF